MMHGGIGKVIKPVGLSDSTGFYTIMRYRWKKMESNEIKKIWPITFCIQEEGIWFIYKERFLCRFLYTNKRVEYITSIPIRDVQVNSFFSMNKATENVLIMMPTNTDEIFIYNISNDKWDKVRLNHPIRPNFISSYEIDGYIYMIPFAYSHVIRINKDTLKVEYYLDVKETIGEECFFNDSCIIEQKKIGCVNPNNNKLYIIDLDAKKIEINQIGSDQNKYEYISTDGNEIVLVDNVNLEMVLLSYVDKSIKYIWWPKDKREKLVANFVGENCLLVDSIFSRWDAFYNINGTLICENYYDEKMHVKNPNHYRGIFRTSKDIMLYFNNSNYILQRKKGIYTQEEYELIVDKNFEKEIMKSLKEKNELIEEDNLLDLTSFLENMGD